MIRLNKQREEFVQNLIKGLSQRKAYKAAFKCGKMTDKTIDEKASRLFADDKVRTRYNEIRDRIVTEAENECIIEAKEILREWKAIAFSKVTNYAEIVDGPQGMECVLKETGSISDFDIRAVSSIKQGANGIEVKLYDKTKALQFLSEYTKLIDEKSSNIPVVNIYNDLPGGDKDA